MDRIVHAKILNSSGGIFVYLRKKFYNVPFIIKDNLSSLPTTDIISAISSLFNILFTFFMVVYLAYSLHVANYDFEKPLAILSR